MQPPASRPTQPGAGDDETVLLNSRTIDHAARSNGPRPGPPPYPPSSGSPSYPPTYGSPSYGSPSYPSRPYPAANTAWTNAVARADAASEGEGDDDPKFSLTSTQVIASMSAAVVAAFLGAQLGVAGTIVGAAIASVVSVVGSAVIGHSLLVTRSKVARTVQHVRAAGNADAETALLTAVARQDLDRVALHAPPGAPTSSSTTGRPASPAGSPSPTAPSSGRGTAGRGTADRWWRRPGRLRWVLVGLAASVAVFAGALGAVTVVEAVKGGPISGGTSGFSVLGGGGDSRTTAPAESSSSGDPTTTAGSTPSSATTAPTSTSAAPSTHAGTSASTAPSTTRSSTTAPTTTAAPAPAGGGTTADGATTAGAATTAN